jgi:uncharacterized surface protein with fasciclin (FAS1) repeats
MNSYNGRDWRRRATLLGASMAATNTYAEPGSERGAGAQGATKEMAHVQNSDIHAINGVIHVIDKVILP